MKEELMLNMTPEETQKIAEIIRRIAAGGEDSPQEKPEPMSKLGYVKDLPVYAHENIQSDSQIRKRRRNGG